MKEFSQRKQNKYICLYWKDSTAKSYRKEKFKNKMEIQQQQHSICFFQWQSDRKKERNLHYFRKNRKQNPEMQSDSKKNRRFQISETCLELK